MKILVISLFLCFISLFPTMASSLDPAVSSVPLTENPDVEAQLKGDYPPLERKENNVSRETEALPLGAIQHAWDASAPQAGVYQVTYHPHEVMRVRCREMMTTTLVFPKWERLETWRVGDAGSFKVETPQPHLLLIQPQEFIGVDTNLTVIGASGKVYTFYLRSEGYNTKHITDLTVYVRVPKPSAIDLTTVTLPASQEKEEYLEEATFDPEALTFAFDMRGDVDIAPVRVYSDGIRTWFDYGETLAQKDLPAIYRVVDGVDTPLNVTRHGTKLMAQGAGAFTLISGQKVVCVTPTKETS